MDRPQWLFLLELLLGMSQVAIIVLLGITRQLLRLLCPPPPLRFVFNALLALILSSMPPQIRLERFLLVSAMIRMPLPSPLLDSSLANVRQVFQDLFQHLNLPRVAAPLAQLVQILQSVPRVNVWTH